MEKIAEKPAAMDRNRTRENGRQAGPIPKEKVAARDTHNPKETH